MKVYCETCNKRVTKLKSHVKTAKHIRNSKLGYKVISKAVERVNSDTCDKLSMLTFKQFKRIFYEDSDDKEVEVQYQIVKKYCNLQKKSQYVLKRDYKYVDGKTEGRLYVNDCGIQRIHHQIRGALMDGNNLDLDMANAHPVILTKVICVKDDIDTTSIDMYINNREAQLAELMNELTISRSEAKVLYLKSINKHERISHYKKRKIKNKKFLEFDANAKKVQKALYDKYRLVKSGYNKEGRTLNLLLCKYENIILQECMNEVQDMGEIHVLMFDGFMMQPSDGIAKEAIVQRLNARSERYGIKWTVKDHDTSCVEALKNAEDEGVVSMIADSQKDLVMQMLDTALKGMLYRCNGNLYFNTGDEWLREKSVIKDVLYKFYMQQEMFIRKDGVPVEVNTHKMISDLVNMTIPMAEENNTLIDDIHINTKLKIKFNNGYYDMKEGKFVQGKLDSFVKVNTDLNLTSNKKLRKKILKKVFNPIFSIDKPKKDKVRVQLRDRFLHQMSRCMAGCVEDKLWYVLQGLRDCGKGVMADLLKNTFGDYVSCTNAENFVKKRFGESDTAKALHWLIDVRHSRLVVTQEIEIDEKTEINGVLMKKFASGGDYITARKLHENQESFQLQCGLLLCCNDLPVIKPTDTMEKCEMYAMTSKFINDSFKESSKLATFKYYKADPQIKEWIKRDDVCNEFALMLFEYFHKEAEYPEELATEVQENGDDDDDESQLFSMFKFTNVASDRVFSADIKRLLKEMRINISIRKANILLKTKGAKSFRNGAKRGLQGLVFNFD